MTLRIVDIETTGESYPDHKVVELAACDLEDSGQLLKPISQLVNPERPIPADARGIHHISDADVAYARKLDAVAQLIMTAYPYPQIEAFVAHNAKFDMQWLQPFNTASIPWICTYKVALRLWPQSPNHKNQTLRYHLGIEVPGKLAEPVHRAGSDCVVTAYILRAAQKLASIAQMIEWSSLPAYLLDIPIRFGKYRGEAWSDIAIRDEKYLMWVYNSSDMDDDVKWNAKQCLTLRDRARTMIKRDGYMSLVPEVIKMARNKADLREWFRARQIDKFPELMIIKGFPEYETIVRLCAEKQASLERENDNGGTIQQSGGSDAASPQLDPSCQTPLPATVRCADIGERGTETW